MNSQHLAVDKEASLSSSDRINAMLRREREKLQQQSVREGRFFPEECVLLL